MKNESDKTIAEVTDSVEIDRETRLRHPTWDV